MRGLPCSLQGKGLLEVEEAAAEDLWRIATALAPTDTNSRSSAGIKKEGFEPRSVLDHRRSPSPPTSASTLSSSLGGRGGGGSGSIDSAGLVTVSDTPHFKWVPTQGTTSSALAAAAVGGGPGMMEDWEIVISDLPLPAFPGQDQSFLGWVMGDADDSPAAFVLKQQDAQRMLPQGPVDFEASDGSGGFGVIDPGFGGEISGGMGSGAPGSMAPPRLACSAPVTSREEFSVMDSNNGSTDSSNRILLPLPVPLGAAFLEPTMEEKPHFCRPSLLLDQRQVVPPQNSAFFLPLSPNAQPVPDHHQQHLLLFPPQPKHHQFTVQHQCQSPPSVPFCDSGQHQQLQQPQQQQQQQQSLESLHVLSHHHIQQLTMKPKVAGGEATTVAAAQHQHLNLHLQHQQALVDELFKAAELIEAKNFPNARVILARLNHMLSPVGKPLVRSAFYCKEALQLIVNNSSNSIPPSAPLLQWHNPSPMALSTPLDIVLKLSAYKAFSDVSPILQFANFTCTQALLEELNGCNRIHIIDFDIGVGGQWSSFMEELAQRHCANMAATPYLKITAFTSSSHQSLELGLARESLSHFAGGLNIPFEFNIVNNDPLDLSSLLSMSQQDEAIAVNLPVSSAYPSILSLLRLVKYLSPKILVSVDQGWDHNGLVFPHHFLNTLQCATILLESIDAAGTSPDVASRIERYLLQPRIENAVLGHHRAVEKDLPWRTLFASAGFKSVPFSSFTAMQAECLLRRIQVKGFHLEKHQGSLLLCWHHGLLVSVSSWKC